MSDRVRVPTAYAVVLNHLRREIQLGRISPGDKFPPEREYALQLGVSRVTLREAIRVLEGEGLVEVRRGAGGGASVLPLGPPSPHPKLDFDVIMGLQELREAVEPLAARRATERRRPESLEALENLVTGLADVEDVGAFRSLDSAFHLRIAEMADCAPLLRAVEDTRIAMFESLDLLEFKITLAATQEAHSRVLNAIKDGDPAAADLCMAEHIRDTTSEIVALYKRLT